ncbi:uncharacterized protein ACRADG_010107 [Cochliomyia hominivorax]
MTTTAEFATITKINKATTKITTNLKLLKMQQFMFLIILILIINSTFVISNSTDEEAIEKRVHEIREKCIKSSKLTKEQAKTIYQHKLFTKDTTAANTPKAVQCYCTCYLHEFGIFINDKPNEKFLRDNLPTLINDKKKADIVLDKCTKLEGKDKCAIGFNFLLCLIKETTLYVY